MEAKGGKADVSFVFYSVADLKRKGDGGNLSPWPGDFGCAFLFFLPVYGVQLEKGGSGFPADPALCPLFLGAGEGDCEGKCLCAEDYPVAGTAAGTGFCVF